MTLPGLEVQSAGTLVDKAITRLGTGALDDATVTADILGIPGAPRAVAARLAVALLGADPRVARRTDGLWALVDRPQGSPRLEDCVFAVVDVETTGMRAGFGDRITEIAVATLSGDTVELVFDALVNPGVAIPPFISQLTRITDEMVRDLPPFSSIAEELLQVLSGRVFTAHNAPFDWRFVTAELKRARDVQLDGPRVCTVRLARRVLPGLHSRGLDSLSNYFGIEIANRHRAGGDAVATAHVLRRLLGLAMEQGAVTLDDLSRVGQRRPRGRRSAFPKSMPDFDP